VARFLRTTKNRDALSCPLTFIALTCTTLYKVEISQSFENKRKENKPNFLLQTNT